MTVLAPIATGRRTILWVAIAAGLLLLAGANAPLVYVALRSQPECVAPARPGESARVAGEYSAARSACSPL